MEDTIMAKAERRSVIVTFKPKDKRADKKTDKLDIFLAAVTSQVSFFNADDFSRGVPVPSSMLEDVIGYDVNRYEAPIVMASLTEKEIDTLKEDKNVAAVEDDGPCWAMGSLLDPGAMIVEGQPSVQAETIPAGVAQIKAPAAWDCTKGKVIKVGVLDTGIDYNHPDLKPNFKWGISFVPGESSVMDYNSHGTHCAGTIAAAINGSGVVGVAPSAYLYGIKVLSKTGKGYWSYLISGIDWCINKKGLDVLSMSLGGSAAPTALKKMCALAWAKGALLVAAAGNIVPQAPANSVMYPAKYGSVVAVSNISSTNVRHPTSCYGPEVELCAPGVYVLSTLPGGNYGTKTGTSMACPHVSGAAALAWGTHRYADNVTIRRLLAWRADNLAGPGRDPDTGFGRVDAEQVAAEMSTPPAITGIP
jgi:subtilisin